MKLYEAVFDALSETDERMLEHSERKPRSFLVHMAPLAGVLVLVLCMVLMPPQTAMGNAAGGKAEHSEAVSEPTAASDTTNQSNLQYELSYSPDLSARLEAGETVKVRITAQAGDLRKEAERLYAILQKAGISVEIHGNSCIALLNQKDVERIAWPDDTPWMLEDAKEMQ